MSDIGFGRSLSGAAKRKIRKDKEAANEKLLAKIPKFHVLGFVPMHLFERMKELNLFEMM